MFDLSAALVCLPPTTRHSPAETAVCGSRIGDGGAWPESFARMSDAELDAFADELTETLPAWRPPADTPSRQGRAHSS
jgi:hypothetical protein